MCQLYQNRASETLHRLVEVTGGKCSLVSMRGHVPFTVSQDKLLQYYKDTGTTADCQRCRGRECLGGQE